MEQLAKPNVPIPAEDVDALFEQYADTVRRLCMVHLKNHADTEDIFQTFF